MVGVNITLDPAQILPEGLAAILMVGVTPAVILAVALTVAVVGDAHAELDVMVTLITSPFTKALLLNVDEVLTGLPFNVHA